MAFDIVAPMGGKIISVGINPGDSIEAEDEILAMEAMKMEMPVVAPEGGTVKEVLVAVGEAVEADQVLARLE